MRNFKKEIKQFNPKTQFLYLIAVQIVEKPYANLVDEEDKR